MQEGSVDGAAGATERAPGADEVDGATLRQQVSDGRRRGRVAHTCRNRTLNVRIPWITSHLAVLLPGVHRVTSRLGLTVTVFADDAHRAGTVGADHLTKGPKVRRG